MRILVTPTFDRAVHKLHKQQKAALDEAVRAVAARLRYFAQGGAVACEGGRGRVCRRGSQVARGCSHQGGGAAHQDLHHAWQFASTTQGSLLRMRRLVAPHGVHYRARGSVVRR